MGRRRTVGGGVVTLWEALDRKAGVHQFAETLRPPLVVDKSAVHLYPGSGGKDDVGHFHYIGREPVGRCDKSHPFQQHLGDVRFNGDDPFHLAGGHCFSEGDVFLLPCQECRAEGVGA